MRTIAAYRWAQEKLRGTQSSGDLEEAQLILTVERTGYDRERVRTRHHPLGRRGSARPPRPLCAARPRYLARRASFTGPQARRFSPTTRRYPSSERLEIVDLFDVVLCAQQPEIGVFKPNPAWPFWWRSNG